MFILNREDGTPVHGVEERPQTKADVPGEWYPGSQPIPRKPGPLARVSMTRNDLVTAGDTTPAHADACRALRDRVQFRNDGPYTPWNYRPNGGRDDRIRHDRRLRWFHPVSALDVGDGRRRHELQHLASVAAPRRGLRNAAGECRRALDLRRQCTDHVDPVQSDQLA
jgi:hypothetical protein